jgi:hypothetical protein
MHGTVDLIIREIDSLYSLLYLAEYHVKLLRCQLIVCQIKALSGGKML